MHSNIQCITVETFKNVIKYEKFTAITVTIETLKEEKLLHTCICLVFYILVMLK